MNYKNFHGYEVDHIDRDTSNNYLSNLELVTPKENQRRWREDEKYR